MGRVRDDSHAARCARRIGPARRTKRTTAGGPNLPTEPHAPDLLTRDRILGGDRQAAAALFRDHVDGLFEFVHYRVGGDRAVVEDIVQDCFLVSLQRLESFDGRSSLHTWLCGIAKNKIREHRRRRRPQSLPDLLDAADPEIFEILADVEHTPLPDWVLERRETQALVGATLSSLPPAYREALLAKYVEGLSVAEMASRSGKSNKATESALTRARVAFARIFTLLNGGAGGEA
jgi:RNA polymerase sigma-70 factor (ECF subfamily)